MSDFPLVSVIIPCYNAEKYIEKAVRSIMAQSYKNIEILIRDDCSSDGSFLILQTLASIDSRIKLFKNEQNKKIVYTLNKLVEQASGKYIARMDADDISLPKRIEKQVRFMEKNEDCALCGCNIFRIDEYDNKIGKTIFPRSFKDNQYFSKFSPTLCHPTVIARAEVLKENKYDPNYDYAEDYELWTRLLKRGFRIANLQDFLFSYRIFEKQVSNIHKGKQIELTKQILINSKFINEDEILSHIHIFVSQDFYLTNNEKRYISKILSELYLKDFSLSLQVAARIVLFIIRSKDLLFLLKSLCNPYAFFACILGVFHKFQKKRII